MGYGLLFFKQKTEYELRISDWSSDVCSSDLALPRFPRSGARDVAQHPDLNFPNVAGPEVRAHLTALFEAFASNHSGPTEPPATRSEARRVGKECVSTCRSRWSPSP